MTDGALIFGFAFQDDGAVRHLTWDEIKGKPAEQPGERRWLHLNRRSPEVRDWLLNESEIDDLVDSALLQEDTRPRCNRVGDGLLINLRGVNLNEGAAPEDMLALRMWATAGVVVSLRAYHIKAVQDLYEKIELGQVPESSGDLIAYLAEHLTDRIEPVLSDLDDQADRYEEELLLPDGALPKSALAEFRRKVLSLRRYVVPQREALNHMARENQDFFSADQLLHLRETADRVTRICEDLDTIRERSFVLQEQVVEERAEAMNQRLFVLSIISAIFLPLGFVTGLFGVNVGGMPGVHSGVAFTLLCLGMLCLSIGMIFVFRRLRWL